MPPGYDSNKSESESESESECGVVSLILHLAVSVKTPTYNKQTDTYTDTRQLIPEITSITRVTSGQSNLT